VSVALDLHQDHLTEGLGPAAYHYAFGDLARYEPIVAAIEARPDPPSSDGAGSCRPTRAASRRRSIAVRTVDGRASSSLRWNVLDPPARAASVTSETWAPRRSRRLRGRASDQRPPLASPGSESQGKTLRAVEPTNRGSRGLVAHHASGRRCSRS
jgi:hypothetical protein